MADVMAEKKAEKTAVTMALMKDSPIKKANQKQKGWKMADYSACCLVGTLVHLSPLLHSAV